MAIGYISEDELDDYLGLPDCPECGSEDVVLVATIRDGKTTIKQYHCNKCGYTWTQRFTS